MAKNVVQQIRRATRRPFGAKEKIRIVLEGLRGEISVAELCRREGIAPTVYYRWSKDFLEAGKMDRLPEPDRPRGGVNLPGLRRVPGRPRRGAPESPPVFFGGIHVSQTPSLNSRESCLSTLSFARTEVKPVKWREPLVTAE